MEGLEKIYPLTIVSRRYGGYAVVNCHAYYNCVSDLQENEEWSYFDETEVNMKKSWPDIRYGIGATLRSALENYWINDKRITKRENRIRNRPLNKKENQELQRIIPILSKSIGSIGTQALVDIKPMSGMPEANLFYLDPPKR